MGCQNESQVYLTKGKGQISYMITPAEKGYIFYQSTQLYICIGKYKVLKIISSNTFMKNHFEPI